MPLVQPKTGYESQGRCRTGRLLSYHGRRGESELKIEHRTESDLLLMRKSIGSFFLCLKLLKGGGADAYDL